MVIVLAKVRFRPENLAAALGLSREHVHRSRGEPGCISHAVYEDPEHAGQLVFVEEWADEAALKVHFQVPASASFVKQLTALAVGRPVFKLFTASELPFPQLGPAS